MSDAIYKVEAEINLLECPFCGGEAVISEMNEIDDTTVYRVVCSLCFITTPKRTDLDGMVNRWNRRAK